MARLLDIALSNGSCFGLDPFGRGPGFKGQPGRRREFAEHLDQMAE